MDHQALPPADLYLFCPPEPAVEDLLRAIDARPRAAPANTATATHARARTIPSVADDARISIAMVADALKSAVGDDDVCLIHLPLGWSGELWDFRHPLDFIGSDGGGGIGAGPGLTVGAAIALKGSKRLPVAILGDGDYLMGVTAFWTAATSGVPFLAIVCNNRSFYNDEVHQERVAKDRDRPIANKWIGQRIDHPAPDLAMMARAQGVEGIGPVTAADALQAALADAVARLRQGKGVVVDVHVTPGYSPSMAAGITRSH
jgi:thiamine pyrophosphate-dependent acetolactate synthase large subunit-like protein